MFDTHSTPQPDAVSAASQAGGYNAFANSPLWDLQRQYFSQRGLDAWAEAQVPHYVTSHPSMAKAYAQVVLGFWRDLKARGMVAGQPLYIIELGAGSGRFAYHFQLQFFAAFDAIRDPEDKVCYVMTDFAVSTVSQWQQRLHTKLQPFVAQGRLDFAVFDAEADSQLELQHQQIRLRPNSLELPPVVIANYVFDGLRQDLFFLDKERFYEGWVAVETGAEASADKPFSGLKLDYQKRRTIAPKYLNSHWNQLIVSYAKRLPPCALLFPSYALNTLDRLSRLHADNLLLLSADRGSHALKNLASQREPDIARHSSFSLPVNYHALADIIQAQGGSSWASSAGNGLAILAACWRAPTTGTSTWRETALAAQQALQGFNPNDFYRIKQTLETQAQYLSPEQMLAFLRLSQWDTKVFYLMYPYAHDFLGQLPDQVQEEWYQGLREVWRFHLPIGEDYDLAFDLGCLAAELNRWSAATCWFLQSLEHLNLAQQQDQNRSSIYFNLGIAHWQLAAYSEAETYLVKALELAPEPASENEMENSAGNENRLIAPSIRQQLADLRSWQAQCQQLLGAQTLRLSATPANPKLMFGSLLGPHQAQALYRLQRHPELCRLTGVECLQSTGHARDWLQREQTDSKHVLAILHPDLGLIGVAALECPAQSLASAGSRSGRFYYWIGQDYQHQGYGPQALALLHQLASIKGVQHIFSTVAQTNMASQRALAKLGYQRLPFEPIGEPPGYRYHHFGPDASELELHGTLGKLLAELDSGKSLVPLAAQELA